MEGNYTERKMIKGQMNHLITRKWAYIASVAESHLFLKWQSWKHWKEEPKKVDILKGLKRGTGVTGY